MEINIANEYTKTPGGRFEKEGQFSGEDFRKKLLQPKYEECKRRREKLIVNLDGGYGYGSSFLEEAFGGLVRNLKDPQIVNIKIISNEEPKLLEDVRQYITSEIKRQKL